VDSANNILVAALTAVTALTNLPGAYRYSYSGADGLIIYGLFHTSDLTMDQYDIFVSALVGPGVRDIQTRLPAALVSGRIDASVGAMANDVITAAAHDESTAYPLKAADSGSTYIARTGADSDTLETISDQLDTVDAGSGGTLSLVYTVYDNVGGLVAGATVELYATAGMTSIIDSETSDVFGVVTFTNLVAGTYYLKIIKSGYQTVTDSEAVS